MPIYKLSVIILVNYKQQWSVSTYKEPMPSTSTALKVLRIIHSKYIPA